MTLKFLPQIIDDSAFTKKKLEKYLFCLDQVNFIILL